MGHIDLAVPVLHAWYKSSPSGGSHQLLWLSSNEIDKILSFVKYAVVEKVCLKWSYWIQWKARIAEKSLKKESKNSDEVYQEKNLRLQQRTQTKRTMQ